MFCIVSHILPPIKTPGPSSFSVFWSWASYFQPAGAYNPRTTPTSTTSLDHLLLSLQSQTTRTTPLKWVSRKTTKQQDVPIPTRTFWLNGTQTTTMTCIWMSGARIFYRFWTISRTWRMIRRAVGVVFWDKINRMLWITGQRSVASSRKTGAGTLTWRTIPLVPRLSAIVLKDCLLMFVIVFSDYFHLFSSLDRIPIPSFTCFYFTDEQKSTHKIWNWVVSCMIGSLKYNDP